MKIHIYIFQFFCVVSLLSSFDLTANAQLKSQNYNNSPVANGSIDLSSIQTQGQPAISAEDYQKIMKELENAKALLEERNKALDKLMAE